MLSKKAQQADVDPEEASETSDTSIRKMPVFATQKNGYDKQQVEQYVIKVLDALKFQTDRANWGADEVQRLQAERHSNFLTTAAIGEAYARVQLELEDAENKAKEIVEQAKREATAEAMSEKQKLEDELESSRHALEDTRAEAAAIIERAQADALTEAQNTRQQAMLEMEGALADLEHQIADKTATLQEVNGLLDSAKETLRRMSDYIESDLRMHQSGESPLAEFNAREATPAEPEASQDEGGTAPEPEAEAESVDDTAPQADPDESAYAEYTLPPLATVPPPPPPGWAEDQGSSAGDSSDDRPPIALGPTAPEQTSYYDTPLSPPDGQ